ncbi:MAG: hypothetical protein ACYS4W_00465 [Planctomycetota bacterium]
MERGTLPFTPYHFGPSGLLGLVFRKWIDLPVFLLANVVVDIEVLVISGLQLGFPIHRYTHTLLLGAATGIVWAIAAYPLRGVFKKAMQFVRLPYKTSFWKMVTSGILGVWLHVLIDSVYHFDTRPFWPNTRISFWRMLTRHIGYEQAEAVKGYIKDASILLLIAAVTFYVLITNRPPREGNTTPEQAK